MLGFLMLIAAGIVIYSIWFDANAQNRQKKAEHEWRYKTDPNYRKQYDIFYGLELDKRRNRR